jgi:hypothetical protein
MDELKKTDLEWTAIYPGIFMEYYVPGLPTYNNIYAINIDVESNMAGIPGSGDVPITLTYSADIGKYIAALQGLDKWERDYRIAGDTKTWHEVIAIIEKGKGVKLDVEYDSMEKLQKGQVRDLPSYQKTYAMLGGGELAKSTVQGMYAQFGQWMEQGEFMYKDGPILNNVFPEIKPLAFEEAWKKVSSRA